MEDDGTLTARPNFFDLKGKSVRFVPHRTAAIGS